jgi:hypothetical protein
MRMKLESGEAGSVPDLMAAFGLAESYVRKILPIGFLVPDLMEQILDGQQPARLQIGQYLRRETAARLGRAARTVRQTAAIDSQPPGAHGARFASGASPKSGKTPRDNRAQRNAGFCPQNRAETALQRTWEPVRNAREAPCLRAFRHSQNPTVGTRGKEWRRG